MSIAPHRRHRVDPDSNGDVAKLLLGVLLGGRVLARTNPSRRVLEGVVRPALALLDPPRRDQTRGKQ